MTTNNELTDLDKEFILDLIQDNLLMQRYNKNYSRQLIQIADKLHAQGIHTVTAGELIEQERQDNIEK